LEQIIDGIWIINIVLCFLTPFEHDPGFNDKFADIACNYLKPGFILDTLSTLTILFNYEYLWMYYLKFLRAYSYPRALQVLKKTINPVLDWDKCGMSKQAKGNV